MEEMDIDGMDEAMAKLEVYEYPIDLQEHIEKLGVFVINMDSEQANLLIEEILKKIQ